LHAVATPGDVLQANRVLAYFAALAEAQRSLDLKIKTDNVPDLEERWEEAFEAARRYFEEHPEDRDLY
jgi:hypothetical protein